MYYNKQKIDDRIVAVFILGTLCIAVLIVSKIIEFIQSHPIVSIIIAVSIISISAWGIKRYIAYSKVREHKNRILQNEINKQREIEAKKLHNRLIKIIEDFQPLRKHSSEMGYHSELQGCLKVHFPQCRIEVREGSTRPDIVINDIAIEIKGPTTNNGLDSLVSKCMRYSQHYQYLIFVLFDKQCSKSLFNDITYNLKKNYSNLIIIEK